VIPRTIAVTLAALALARPLLAQCPDGMPPPCRGRPVRAAAAPAANSVAVLYFDNLTRDSNDAYLADGLTEDIIGRLSTIERLAVKSHHAVLRYRGSDLEDLAPVARALNVSYLVTGSIRRSGARLRVRAELVRAAGGIQVWGRQFEQAGTDLFAIQEAVAREVATGIVGRLLPNERAAVETRPTRDPAAYDHLLRGNFYLAQRTALAVSRAIEEYEAAARLDPSYADALAHVPYGYALYLDWGWVLPGVPPESLLQRGLRATDRALQLDSLSSDAWMARGYLAAFADPRAFTGLREGFGRAIALNPRNAEAWHQLGAQVQTLGDDSSAVAADLQALALDPARPITLRNLGGIYRDQRRYPEALRWLDSALTADPAAGYVHLDRTYVLLHQGDTAGARASALLVERYMPPERAEVSALRVYLQAATGDSAAARAGAEALARRVSGTAPVWMIPGIDVATALVAVGERGRCLDLLERLRPRGAMLWWRLRDPVWDPIRTEPRFLRLVAESRPPGAR
jgi:TolB-like protein/Tfp pilus assembly protein PilF